MQPSNQVYSTITSLISSTEFWYENTDRSNVDLTMFLDLKRAFHTVDHDILLKKISSYGMRGKAGGWFESYLNNRKRFRSLNGQHSKARDIT